jgi:hypothetical protein
MTALAVLGIYFGEQLTNAGITFSFISFTVLCVVFFTFLVIYNLFLSTGRRRTKNFYFKRKSLDLVLAICSLAMFIFIGNRPDTLMNFGSGAKAARPVTVIVSEEPKTYKSFSAFHKSLKDENGKKLKWKERRKLLKEQLRGIKAAKDMSKGAKLLLTILCVLVATGLLVGIAALSCELSCAGSGAAAALVAVGGTTVVVLLLLAAIHGIHGNRRKPKEVPDQQSGSQ